MIVSELISIIVAVLFMVILIVRYRITKEANFFVYLFERGIGGWFLKFFSLYFILAVISHWFAFFIGDIKLEIDWSFLNYKVF